MTQIDPRLIARPRSIPGYVLSWHCAPRRQYSISLSGQAEIEVGDGTVARVGPGDVVLAEDLTGQGPVPRVAGGEPRFSEILPLTDKYRQDPGGNCSDAT